MEQLVKLRLDNIRVQLAIQLGVLANHGSKQIYVRHCRFRTHRTDTKNEPKQFETPNIVCHIRPITNDVVEETHDEWYKGQ